MSSPAEASSWHSPDAAISGGASKTVSSKDSSNVVSKYLQVPVDSTPRRAERSLPRVKLLTSLDSLRILEEKEGKKSRNNWKSNVKAAREKGAVAQVRINTVT